MKRTLLLVVLAAAIAAPVNAQQNPPPDEFAVLVFTRTAGFRHSSIPDGIAAVVRLADRNGFSVDATEDPRVFSADRLENYQVVVFLSTTGDVLNGEQEAALQSWVESGHGLVGVHAAADTEYDWPWYGRAVGAYFKSHPRNQTATVKVEDASHPSTEHLPAEWVRLDEWYNYRANPRENVHVLMTLDETTYEGGEMGDDHPISWAHSVGEGRVWYTGLGHTEESYVEEAYVRHLLGGILWAAGRVGEDVGDAGVAPAHRFEKVILNDDTLDPFELAVADDGRVIFIERAGTVRIWHPETGRTTTAGYVPVRTTGENGMLGLALDPDFSSNHWIYLFRTVPDGEPRQQLSRFFLDDGQLDLSSEKVLLEVPLSLGECCHSGGSLAFGPDGNLFISIGDETNPFASDGYNPIDERVGRDIWDAQRSSANTDDLRGKILRITPRADGTYAIPQGNLFPADGSAGRPEIYVMGNRNPFRITVDQENGWLYWGEVGPDAGAPDDSRGPAGHDEINQAKGPGNFGWPYFTGDNKAYHDFDFTTVTPGDPFDPAWPVNDSPNNTGSHDLPPAQPALIWYPYGPSEEFPNMEAGGRTAIAGPVYRYDAATAAPGALPESFDGAFFFGEWQRNQLFAARLDDEGNLLSFERFLPEMEVLRPMDMDIGPDGRFYLIEWGTSYGGNNPDARIVRLDYSSGPSKTAAAAPIDVPSASPRFISPVSGALGRPGEALAYEVSVPEGVNPDSVRIEAVLETDGNERARTEATGTSGVVTLPDGTSPWPELVGRRWRLTATYEDGSGHVRASSVYLHPTRLEAEHTARYHEANKNVSYDAETKRTNAGLLLSADSWAAYGPLDLSGVDSLVAELAPFSAGTLEFRRDSLGGPVVATVPISADHARSLFADTATVSASFRALYDDDNLYLAIEVLDDDVQINTEMESRNDRIELYFDAGYERGISYDDNDLRIDLPIGQGPDGAVSKQVGRPEMTYAMRPGGGGYVLEVALPWSTIRTEPADGATMGFEININDLDADRPDRTLAWAAMRDVAWSEPRVFGTLQTGGDAPTGRRRGALTVAARTNVSVETDGVLDSAWSIADPVRLRRHLGLNGVPADPMQLRERVSATVVSATGPAELYVVFRPEAERGRVYLDRISFVRQADTPSHESARSRLPRQ